MSLLVITTSLFGYLSFSLFLAKKLNKEAFLAWWIIIFFTLAILAVQLFGAFNILNQQNILISSLALIAITFFKPKSLIGLSLKDFREIFSYNKDFYFPLFLTLILALLNYLMPVFETDSLGYHLPIVTQLAKTQSIWDVFYTPYVGPNTYFPANHEAIQSFFYILTNSLNFYFLLNLLSIFLFALSFKNLTKNYNFSFNLIVIFSTFTIPFLFEQLFTQQVDLFLLLLVGSTINFLFSAIWQKNSQDLAKAFLIIGLIIGSKYSGPAQAVIFLPLLIAAFISLRKTIKTVIWMPLLMFITGSGWYIRNLISADNPFYPFKIEIGSYIAEGYQKLELQMANTSIFAALKTHSPIDIIKHILGNPNLGNSVGYFGPSILLFALIILVILGIYTFKKPSNSDNPKNSKMFFIAIIYLLILESFYYINTPYSYTLWNETIRYISPLFALFPILFIYSADLSKTLKRVILGFAIIYSFLNIFTNKFFVKIDYLVFLKEKISLISPVYFLITLGIFLLVIVLFLIPIKNKKLTYPALLLISFLLGTFSLNIDQKFLKNSHLDDQFISQSSPYYQNLLPFLQELRKENHKSQNPPNIALSGFNNYWIFEKENFNPIYVNIDGCTTCKYPFYIKTSIRENPDEEKWKNALSTLDIKYLIIDTQKNIEDYEEIWAEKNPDLFTPILTNQNFLLYKINIPSK